METTDARTAPADDGVGNSALFGIRGTRDALAYIAESPSREYGGFHESAILAAKSAIWHLDAMGGDVANMREAIKEACAVIDGLLERADRIDDNHAVRALLGARNRLRAALANTKGET